MFGLEYFGFRALWSPVVLLIFIAIGIVYLLLTGPWSHRFKEAERVPVYKIISFLSGLFLLYLAQAGPLSLLSHLMFSAHMLGMAVSYIIAPPLLLIGLPAWMVKPLLQRLRWLRPLRFMMHPLLTVVFFNALFSFYHLPDVHDYVMVHYGIHLLFYIALFITSVMMWWHVICPVPEYTVLSGLKKMGYIFINGVLITPACALIIFSDHAMYAVFNDANTWARAMGYCVPNGQNWVLDEFAGPQFFSLVSSREDQQLGGVIMKLLQEITYGLLLGYVFREWYKKENPEEEDLNPIMDPS
ncbi:cytochrome c oxidase assembly factor CtaG [Marinicrinis lubricantis]|uniref:Cytochrome c oxidase assembly factor CtaG n=1 Tax=Marinicrinis lubricantis TaxID=2086470 RepID=A0ABW1ITZ2_9BACL